MMSKRLCSRLRLGSILFACVLSLLWDAAAHAEKPAKTRWGTVWVVFFSSTDCPRCLNVDQLIRALKKKYPVKLKKFSIDRPEDYALFQALEAIHGEHRFAVPLVILGESIMGEDNIEGSLEKTVRRLSRSGGSRLPYLGPPGKKEPRSMRSGSYGYAGPSGICEGRGVIRKNRAELLVGKPFRW